MVSVTQHSFRDLVDAPHPGPAVHVSIINTTARIHGVKTQDFFGPPIANHQWLAAPVLSFLIRHPGTGQTLLFDLGIRKDWQNLSPSVLSRIESSRWTLDVPHDVATILSQSGVNPQSVNTIILSHPHFDHTGDPSTFPSSTNLVVGPGSPLLESDYSNRTLIELNFHNHSLYKILQIGAFLAIDYFSDGSFYLLDSPGHAAGHICGLARVTSSASGGKNEFVLMAGDAFHHVGELRPSALLPLPSCSTQIAGRRRTTPFYTPVLGRGNWHADAQEAERTLKKLQEADALEEILVVAAHDETVLKVVGVFPGDVGGFVEKGWKGRARWRFLEDFKGSSEATGGNSGSFDG